MKRLMVLILCLSLISAWLIPIDAKAMEPASDTIYRGIDVSEWQGSIDFRKVADSGIKVVYIRASLGSNYVDPQFEANYRKAKAAGLSVGFYHYVTARSRVQAEYEANFFVNTIRGKTFECRPAMDFEDLSGLSENEIRTISSAFLTTLERSGGKGAVLYSDAYNAANTFSGSLTRYPLWVAQYGVSRPSDTNWDKWSGWQYSDEGRIPGINGYVDLDRFTDGVFLDRSGSITTRRTEPKAARCYLKYRVKAGDTLWSIANLYHTTVSALVSANRIQNPNRIYVGQELRIPCHAGKPQVTHPLLSYRVRPGDYLGKIAAKYGTTVRTLVSINGIKNPNLIYVGERLWIPLK